MLQNYSPGGFECNEVIMEQAKSCGSSDLTFEEDFCFQPSPPSTLSLSAVQSRKMISNFTLTDGVLAPMSPAQSTSLCGGVFEMESEVPPEVTDQRNKTKFQVKRTNESLTYDKQELLTEAHEPKRNNKFEVSKTSTEDVFESPKMRMFSSQSTSSAEGESPVLTLASSFKDSSSISRGFVVRDMPKQP